MYWAAIYFKTGWYAKPATDKLNGFTRVFKKYIPVRAVTFRYADSAILAGTIKNDVIKKKIGQGLRLQICFLFHDAPYKTALTRAICWYFCWYVKKQFNFFN